MSLHKLTAGSGYEYLIRQVAVQDSTEKRHTSLASYYSEKGEAPGLWLGSGLTGIDGISVGDVVTEAQMKSLFAYGHHPLASERLAEARVGASMVEMRKAQRLGTPFKVLEGDVPSFHVEVARRLGELNVEEGRPRDTAVNIDERARVRTEVACEHFEREHGRRPESSRELAATEAKLSRPKTSAVAGYDLTFSPVKSVSTLWAVADPQTAALVERAHHAAVTDALAFIEKEALFTREGTGGVRQVDVTGLVAASFTHRDSRAGDPDLHTHVAVANKVQTLNGKWLAIDGRVLFKANVSASETYNTALERHLTAALGVRFAERPNADPRKRPVREIVGIDSGLNARWSSRRVSIEARRAELATHFQRTHGRPPSPIESIALAQQATLETRDPKHEPRSLAEQRAAWHEQAVEVLGDAEAVAGMVDGAMHGLAPVGVRVTAEWIAECGADVVQEVEQRRATWQVWHLRAEAQRKVRYADVPADRVADVVQLVIDAAIERSVSLVTDRDPIRDPDELRRKDGTSVYRVAGGDLFTSKAVLNAEQSVVSAAGRFDGHRVGDDVVDLALAESAANGTEFNVGQAALVRGMATSGARVQLGIAAAGTGKTTAMGTLTRAWEEAGGNVIGLAPAAAAAAALGQHTGATTDTLAILIHALDCGGQGQVPDRIDAGTLVMIDEAGMADTISLARAIEFAIDRGASVRLIGDDQQLAAIGAGGVLRDIHAQHGSLRLSELKRFADPAEGAATLALRDGLNESLGYYFDNDRVHVGDLTTVTDSVFDSWKRDRESGLDSIMLAPTRDLVADLNGRARRDRLAEVPDIGPTVRLTDGNDASVGDIVITRHNDRRLRTAPMDWVKNGDRWAVLGVHDGRLRLKHAVSGLRVVLPAKYVTEHTELGYASTVHTAQGVSVDTMHGLSTGEESRQQLYTMMSRGRLANHVYLAIAGDGDPHNLIRPETIHPSTATDVLENVLARDASPRSATTLTTEAASPTSQLKDAAPRYIDALYFSAEQLIGSERVHAIEQSADELLPLISDEPAWPTLRSHLILLEAQGRDCLRELRGAVAERTLDGVDDRAAILDWRLDPTGLRGANAGPLSWMPAVPKPLATHPKWGPNLKQRAQRVEDLANIVRRSTDENGVPVWTRQGGRRPTAEVTADIAVWRAANGVDPADRRPTGPPQVQKALAIYQRQLDERVQGGRGPALAEWGPAIDRLHARRDSFTPLLAERLAAISRAGVDAAGLLAGAAAEGHLPDDHVAAALWWRISRHLSPAVAVQAVDPSPPIATDWSEQLIDVLGYERAAEVTGSPWWPTLVASVEQATHRGWAITDLLDLAPADTTEDVDLAQAIVWRIAVVTDPPPEDPFEFEPPPDQSAAEIAWLPYDISTDERPTLAQVALVRNLLDPLEPSDSDIVRALDRADQWEHSPVSGERILQINQMAADYFEGNFEGSWAATYLHQRLGQDLQADARFRPGFAPPGWTNLVDHLRQHGVAAAELLAAGVASTASTGRLIDRFRDRAILPVIHDSQILGFVGRRHPDAGDGTKSGPKYLNTGDTIVFLKGAQLYGIADDMVALGSIPVLVEGPVDAIAVTLATAGSFVGVAPLGTSLTHEQAAQLAHLGNEHIIATDGDLAGRIAAERDYWLLAPHQVDPRYAQFKPGEDPASILEQHGRKELVLALQNTHPLAEELIAERLANIPAPADQLVESAQVIAARPAEHWGPDIAAVARRVDADNAAIERAVVDVAAEFNRDSRRYSNHKLESTSSVRTRLEQAANASPAERWALLARSLSPRLPAQRDWPATAEMLEQVQGAGYDVAALTHQLVAQSPLSEKPAQDLRYRLIGYLPNLPQVPIPNPEVGTSPVAPGGPEPGGHSPRNHTKAPRR